MMDMKGVVQSVEVNKRKGKEGNGEWQSVKLRIIPEPTQKAFLKNDYKSGIVQIELGSNFHEAMFKKENPADLTTGDVVGVKNLRVVYKAAVREFELAIGSLNAECMITKLDDAELKGMAKQMLDKVPEGAKPMNEVWSGEALSERKASLLDIAALAGVMSQPPKSLDDKGSRSLRWCCLQRFPCVPFRLP